MGWPEPDADPETLGGAMHDLVRELYPEPRSITGDGLRRTLARLDELLPLDLHEVPSGTRVLDWTVPDEWNVREAWIEGPDGRRIVDFADTPLHLMGYSVPVDERMSLQELKPHLHTLPDQPDRIPYRTSYYREAWGFCLPHRVYEDLPEGPYRVRIDATLEPGSLTYGEAVIPGRSDEVVLLSCHACHAGLANDNLSGIAVAVALGRALRARDDRRYTYRILFIPGTIGAITWLARNRDVADRVRHGLVLSGVGDDGDPTYKRTRHDDAEIDRAVNLVLERSGDTFETRPFTPYGYDERQYGSPGFDLPVGCFMRTPWGEYPEYHTSDDDPDFVHPDRLADSYAKLRAVLEVLEANRSYRNLRPHGEPQLGRRGLYRSTGGAELPDYEHALLWVLNLSDGEHSLLDVAERSGLSFPALSKAADDLVDADLLAPLDAEGGG